jgi:hypothetical protein
MIVAVEPMSKNFDAPEKINSSANSTRPIVIIISRPPNVQRQHEPKRHARNLDHYI